MRNKKNDHTIRNKIRGGHFYMESNQKINCTVSSCKYNQNQEQACTLKQIIVTPMQDCQTKEPDESMCSSYKYEKNN